MADLVVPQLASRSPRRSSRKWLKNVGDAVAVDEPVAELETDKITVAAAGAGRGRARRAALRRGRRRSRSAT